MADNLDAPGPAGPDAGPHPEGDSPLDFLAESSESKPEATHSAEAVYPPLPGDAVAAPHHPIFPFLMGGAFAALIVIAWVMNMQKEVPASLAAEPPAKVVETATSSADLTTLKDELGGLSKQVKDLQEKIEALPKPAPPPDLEPLNAKIAALTKSADTVATLPDKVGALDKKVGAVGHSLEELDNGLATLTSQVAALTADIKKGGEKPAPKPATPAPSATTTTAPVDVNLEGQAMSQGVELFKAGKYKEASDVFKTVENNDPKDARVWYYAAMSRGLATADWKGDTETLVKKGIEREKAGTPKVEEIDSEFAKLPATVKPWLDFYRKTAK